MYASCGKVNRDGDVSLDWAVGLLEGEGCFSIFKRRSKNNLYQCSIFCEMTDEDTVRKLHDILGVGKVTIRPARKNRKSTWILTIQKQQEVFDTLLRVMPQLGKRRLNKAKELFNYLEPIICK